MMVLCFFTEIQHKKSLAPQAKDFLVYLCG
jgi:hypothetical protein